MRSGERAEAVHCHLRYLSGHVLYSAGRSGSVVPFDDRKDETEKEELIFEDQKRYTEMMDYYGMRAHQIKTPIAAMWILVQSGMDREENEREPEAVSPASDGALKTEQ